MGIRQRTARAAGLPGSYSIGATALITVTRHFTVVLVRACVVWAVAEQQVHTQADMAREQRAGHENACYVA